MRQEKKFNAQLKPNIEKMYSAHVRYSANHKKELHNFLINFSYVNEL